MIIQTLGKVSFSTWFTALICCLCCLADPLPWGVERRRTFPSCRLWLPSQVVVNIRASILLLQYRFSTSHNLKYCRYYTIILRTIFVKPILSSPPYRFSRLLTSFLTMNVTLRLRRHNFKCIFSKLNPSSKTAFVCRDMSFVLIFWFVRKKQWNFVSHLTDRT
jgi:hypothetical protein